MAQRFAYDTETHIQIVAHWCNGCGIAYGLPRGFIEARRKDHETWTCPNGCKRHFPAGESDADKLRRAEAREVALQDQLRAAAHEVEQTKAALLRDRHRFANGVCPSCTRSFSNVARHMASQHPDYDVAQIQGHSEEKPYACSCGRRFHTLGGLHQHQTKQRGAGWFKPSASKWSAHLTEV